VPVNGSASTSSSRPAWLTYAEQAPPAWLAPYVARFYEIRGPGAETTAGLEVAADDPLLRRLLPNADANLVFDLGPTRGFLSFGDAAVRPARALGVCPAPISVSLGPDVDLFGVAFVVGRARPFLPVAPADLAGRIVDLAELWESTADALGERLRERTFEERVSVLSRVLVAHAPAHDPADSDIQAVIERIGADPGGVRVGSLAANTGLSRQRFTRWFTDTVGVGPKRFARIRRLQLLLRHVADGPDEDWSRVALRLGYYDQAHMIGDFRWLTGESPARFRAAHRAARRV